MPEQLPNQSTPAPSKKRYIRLRVTGSREELATLHPVFKTQLESQGYRLGFYWLAPLENNPAIWELKTGYKYHPDRNLHVRSDNQTHATPPKRRPD